MAEGIFKLITFFCVYLKIGDPRNYEKFNGLVKSTFDPTFSLKFGFILMPFGNQLEKSNT